MCPIPPRSVRYRSTRTKRSNDKIKKKNMIKRIVYVILALILLYFALFLLVVPERPDYVVLEQTSPIAIAQRGGAELAPENTFVAFHKAQSLGVDIIEYEIRMTEDGHLVVIHDETVDRTTDGEGKISEMTLEELKQLDAAYHYRDVRGKYIYRGQGITIPTVEEMFIEFPDIAHLINITEDSAFEEGEIEKKLWELITRYQMQDRLIVRSFSEDSISHFQSQAQGVIPVATSGQETVSYAALHKLYLHRLYRPKSDVLYLPTESGFFNLVDRKLIDGAHRLNMKVIYHTVNDEQMMRTILMMGADGIVTDKPDLLIRIMHEMGLRN